MAAYYVWSAATGTGDGSSWANAFTNLSTAYTGKSAGDVFYVADDHAQTQASSLTLASPGTIDSPCQVLCVLRNGGSVPPVAADLRKTATITTTGNSPIVVTGSAYWYGINIFAGSGSAQGTTVSFGQADAALSMMHMKSCSIRLGSSVSSARIIFPQSGNINNSTSVIIWDDVKAEFGHVGHAINLGGADFTWKNSSTPLAGTIPTTLFLLNTTSTKPADITLSGLDLSLAGSGKNLFDISARLIHKIVIENCKLNSSVTLRTGTHPGFGGSTFKMVNSDGADTNYRYEKTDGSGTVTSETVIVRSGGATDGTTPVSRKMVSVARTSYIIPLSSDVIFWNETINSALNLCVEVITDNVTLTDAEAWLEVMSLSTTGFPIETTATDAAATILTTGSNQASSSATWTTTGLANPVTQKFEVTVTPQKKGWIRCRVNLAKPSTTMYFCPLITGIGVVSRRQWQSREAYMIETAPSGGSLINSQQLVRQGWIG